MSALLFPTRLKNVSALYVIGATFALEISFWQDLSGSAYLVRYRMRVNFKVLTLGSASTMYYHRISIYIYF